MSTHRGFSSGHQLPANPHYLDITNSDGDSSQWPTNTARVVDHEDHVNFMRPVPVDESQSIHWRINIAKALAKQLHLPEGPNYVLRSWPDGYQMFDHNKGPKDSPRHDPYLIGSNNVKRFRSVPEFVPHALWLMQDPALDRTNCTCKYCTKTPRQRPISESLGLAHRLHGTPYASQSPGPSRRSKPSKPRPQRDREHHSHVHKPYTAVRRAPRPAKLPEGPKQAMAKERASDLRAAYSNVGFKRWFREGELLWCALNPPIQGSSPQSSIVYWPGIIQEANLKCETVRLNGDQSTGESGSSSVQAKSEPLWTVQQWTVYKMKLLGISYSYLVEDSRVLPYQAYAPPHELLIAMRDTPIQQIDTATERIQAFNPIESSTSGGPRFEDAVAPYSLAIQIGANLAGYWTPTDEWDFKMVIPPVLRTSHDPALVQNDSSSASNQADITSTVNGYSDISGPSHLSADELKSLGVRTLGQPPQPSPGSKTLNQTRYQGLWWGPERIWTDELVRLKLARKQIAPEGTTKILPPSGPSKKTTEFVDAEMSSSSESHDAGGRSVFLRLDGLFVVEVPKEEGGFKKEARACGMLYELADEDWEDENDQAGHEIVRSEGKGKGKARQIDDVMDGLPSPGLSVDPNLLSQGTVPPSILMDQSASDAGQPHPSFLPGPSPLKPPPLPNPDPSVPMQDTAMFVLNESLSTASASDLKKAAAGPRPSNSQISHPVLSTSYPLPAAPLGFKFRSILPPEHEVVISLSLISGRYYPRILSHPLMVPIITHIIKQSGEEHDLFEASHLWSLEGLSPGFFNAVDPSKWKPSRAAMMRDADAEARTDLSAHWQDRFQYAEAGMEVDIM